MKSPVFGLYLPYYTLNSFCFQESAVLRCPGDRKDTAKTSPALDSIRRDSFVTLCAVARWRCPGLRRSRSPLTTRRTPRRRQKNRLRHANCGNCRWSWNSISTNGNGTSWNVCSISSRNRFCRNISAVSVLSGRRSRSWEPTSRAKGRDKTPECQESSRAHPEIRVRHSRCSAGADHATVPAA